MREELKCVLMESGGQCVTVVGIEEKLKLFADNWDTTLHVSDDSDFTKINHLFGLELLLYSRGPILSFIKIW